MWKRNKGYIIFCLLFIISLVIICSGVYNGKTRQKADKERVLRFYMDLELVKEKIVKEERALQAVYSLDSIMIQDIEYLHRESSNSNGIDIAIDFSVSHVLKERLKSLDFRVFCRTPDDFDTLNEGFVFLNFDFPLKAGYSEKFETKEILRGIKYSFDDFLLLDKSIRISGYKTKSFKYSRSYKEPLSHVESRKYYSHEIEKLRSRQVKLEEKISFYSARSKSWSFHWYF